jgi:hypothetical protein
VQSLETIEAQDRKEMAVYERPEIAIAQYVTRTGLDGLPDDLPRKRYRQLIEAARTYSDAQYWIAGDLANFGEAHYGEAYAQFVDVLGYDPSTLQAAMRVARSIPFKDRRPELPWSYHQACASLRKCRNPQHPYPAEVVCAFCVETMQMRRAWLEAAVEGEWKREDLRGHLREAVGRENKPGRPAKKKKVPTPKGFQKLVDKQLEPALERVTDACDQLVADVRELLGDLGKGKERTQADFARLARDMDRFGARLMPVTQALRHARDIAHAIANYQEPAEKPKRKRARSKKKASLNGRG